MDESPTYPPNLEVHPPYYPQYGVLLSDLLCDEI